MNISDQAMAGFRRVTPDDPVAFQAMSNLALWYDKLLKPEKALPLREEVLAGYTRTQPADHPDILWAKWQLAETLFRANRGADAVPHIDECVSRAAGQTRYPKMVPAVLDLRLRHFRKAGDAGGCRATAEMWDSLNRADADSLFGAGRMRAVAAEAFAKADKPAEATVDADRAVGLLAKAVAAGYRDRDALERDFYLDALRGRPDFQQLLASLPHTAPPPRPAAR